MSKPQELKELFPKVYQTFDYDDFASSTFINKYALKDKEGGYVEKDPLETIDRVMGALADCISLSPSKAFVDDIKAYVPAGYCQSWKEIFKYTCKAFKGIVPQGSVLSAAGNLEYLQSYSNCFVVPGPKDLIGSISRSREQTQQIYKRRGGCGTHLSHLRPDGAAVRNAALTSSGAWAFAEGFSGDGRLIGQGGRRAALMLILHILHPDALAWARMKLDLAYCTGANVSLWITDAFMNAVINDEMFLQQFPIDSPNPTITKLVNAKELFREIVKCAHKMGEPGLLMIDNITRMLPAHCYPRFKVTATNPCCFAVNSEVLVNTRDGLKEIKSITSEDSVWIEHEKIWAPTSGYFKSGIAEVFEVILSTGEKLHITSNHKLSIFKDKCELIQLKNIEVGDLVEINASLNSFASIQSIIPLGVAEVGCINVPIYNTFTANGIISGNSEIPLSDYDSCRLISICLLDFVKNPFTSNAYFDFDEFTAYVRICVRMGEALVEAEIAQVGRILAKICGEQNSALPEDKDLYKVEIDLWTNIKETAQAGRRLGLGDHGWGDMLASLCIRYDTQEAIEIAGKIKRLYRDTAYDESVEIAKEVGPFPEFDWEIEKDCEFFATFPPSLLDKMKIYGRRHISMLTNAPTGSMSILAQCSSGIEPSFRLMYTRRRKINASDIGSRVDFTDQSGDTWMEFPQFEKNVERYFKATGREFPTDIKTNDELLKILPDYFITSDKIDWKKRIDFQAELQKYVDHSISSTINLPSETSVEVVEELYLYAWKSGLKGITVYRDGCRTGVLLTNEDSGRPENISRQEAPKRPTNLPCEVTVTSVNGQEYVVILGFLNGTVYEIFAGEHNNQLPNKKFNGEVVKKSKGVYILEYYQDGQKFEVDINEYFKNEEHAATTRLVSTALRHGTPIAYVVEQLLKSGKAFTGFEKSIARILKKFAKKEDLARNILNNSEDNIEVKFEDGCVTVINHTTNTVESKCD